MLMKQKKSCRVIIKRVKNIKLNKQKVGKIQVIAGIILMLVTIIGSYVVMNQIYQGILVNGAFAITEKWGDAADPDGDDIPQETDEKMIAEVTSIMIIISSIYKYALYLFGLGACILLVLSGMLILQGLVNQLKK